MRKQLLVIICTLCLVTLCACGQLPKATDIQNEDNAEVVAVTESAKMPEPPTEMYADTKQQSDEAEQPEAQTENEAQPETGAVPVNTAELYSSFAHMVSFDPESGWAEFDYFDLLKGDEAVEWLVNEEGLLPDEAQAQVDEMADSEFIERNINPQLRTMNLSELQLRLIVDASGSLINGAEGIEADISDVCALYAADPELVLNAYFYFIEAEDGNAVTVEQVYWP